MKSLYKKMELYIKSAEEKLKSSNLISGMTVYNLKKENYIVMKKEDYEELLLKLKEIHSDSVSLE